MTSLLTVSLLRSIGAMLAAFANRAISSCSVDTPFLTRISVNGRFCDAASASRASPVAASSLPTFSRIPRSFLPNWFIASRSSRQGSAVVAVRDALHQAREVGLVVAVLERVLVGDRAGTVQLEQRLVHRAHAERATGLDDRHQLVRLVVADQRADRRVADHDLGRQRAALAGGARDQLLAQHGLQRERQHRADLLLLVRRE